MRRLILNVFQLFDPTLLPKSRDRQLIVDIQKDTTYCHHSVDKLLTCNLQFYNSLLFAGLAPCIFSGFHSHSNRFHVDFNLSGDWSYHRRPPDRTALRFHLHSRRPSVLFSSGCLQTRQRLLW